MSADKIDARRLREAVASERRVPAESVKTVETHISIVAIAPDHSFKLKKPVDLGFVDYRDRDRRRAMCHREIALNRRLAPTIYLGVRGLLAHGSNLALGDEDDGDAIDYLVEMRSFSEDDTLATQIRASTPGPDLLRLVGARMAEFHRFARRVDPPVDPSASYQARFEDNAAELCAALHAADARARVAQHETHCRAFLAAHSEQLKERAQSECWRDGHGDLRAEHILLRDGMIEVIDCVEFDDELRALDVADDLAFLVMDVTRLAGSEVADRLLTAYRDSGGDPGDDQLIAFHAAYRALVRAKVCLLQAAERNDPGVPAAVPDEAARLLDLADWFAWQTRMPVAMILCGAPASGKSTIARAVERISGLPRLDSDVVRKDLYRAAEYDRLPQSAYRGEANQRTYHRLGQRAAAAVRAGGAVIVEATCRRRSEREAFIAGFGDAAPALFIECRAPLEVLIDRARRRTRVPDASDADATVVARAADDWEPLDEIAPERHTVIDSSRPPAESVTEITAVVDRHLVVADSGP